MNKKHAKQASEKATQISASQPNEALETNIYMDCLMKTFEDSKVANTENVWGNFELDDDQNHTKVHYSTHTNTNKD